MTPKSALTSKTVWGAFIGLFAMFFPHALTYVFGISDPSMIAGHVVAIVGFALTIYGRVQAKQPLNLFGSQSGQSGRSGVGTMSMCGAFSMVLLIVACTAAQWFQAFAELVPIAETAVTSFYQFGGTLNGKGLTPAQASTIQNFASSAETILTSIGQDITSVQSATTNEGKIQSLLSTLQGQANNLIPALQIKDPTVIDGTEQFVSEILQDAQDLANLVPTVNGQPVMTPAVASRLTGWPESDFVLVSAPGGQQAVVASDIKLRSLKKEFAGRHNRLRGHRTGNAVVDAALAAAPKADGPNWFGSLVKLHW